jgi:hypothetical protein
MLRTLICVSSRKWSADQSRCDHGLACRAVARGNRTAFALTGFGASAFSRFASGGWWSQTGSNRRPQACKASALPTELWPRCETGTGPPSRSSRKPDRLRPTGLRRVSLLSLCERRLVGPGRVERPTSRLSGVRSNHLSYEPVSRNGLQKSGIRKSKRARLQTKSHAEADPKSRDFRVLTSDSTKGRETKTAAVAAAEVRSRKSGTGLPTLSASIV